MKPLACSLFAAALAMQGQTRQVVLVRSTSGPFTVTAATSNATQAALTYTPPFGSTCGLEVSESPSYLPLVHDVNPAKFASASSDARVGNTANGGSRTFVVGKRSADVGIDGVRYSRALQAYTQHYYRLTCSGSSAVTGTFTTLNIPFGATYAEAQPGDRNAPGDLAQPHISLDNRNESVIDPQTGLLLKRLTKGNDLSSGDISGVALISRGNLSNVTSTTPVYLGVATNGGGYFGYINGDASPYWGGAPYRAAWDYYQIHLHAAVNAGGTAPVGDAGKIITCQTVDGVNCYGTAQSFESVLTNSSTPDTVLGTGTPGDLLQITGTAAPNWTQQGTRVGSVTCDGSTTVTQVPGGQLFSPDWVAGSNININGTDLLIAKFNHTSSLTLTTTCTAGTYPFVANNFGILVRKKTVSSDVVSIATSTATVNLDFVGNFTVRDTPLCSTGTVTGPTGNPGYNCRTLGGGPMYWVDATTGEAHMIGSLDGANCVSVTAQMFSGSDPDTSFCTNTSLATVKYYGNHSEPVSLNSDGNMRLNQILPACNTTGSNVSPYTSQQPCTVTTALTPGTSLATLVQSFTASTAPQFVPARFTTQTFLDSDSQGNMMFFLQSSANGFSLGWNVIYNPTATTNGEPGNAGCVLSVAGCVVAAMPSWERPGCRWCSMKDGTTIAPGWVQTQFVGWQSSGPYYVTAIDGTANGTGNFLDGTTTLGACPANSFGSGTSQKCTRLTISAEPKSNGTSPGETGLAGELGPAKVGDYFTAQPSAPQGPYEQMALIAKTAGAAAGTWIYTLLRNVNGAALPGYYSTTAANPTLYTICNSEPYPFVAGWGSAGEWNFGTDAHGLNTTGNTVSGSTDHINFNGHYFWSNGNYVAVEGPSNDARCSGNCYATRTPGTGTILQAVQLSAATAMIQNAPVFAGSVAYEALTAGASSLQSHVTRGGDQADPTRFPYFFDGRPYRGGFSSGSVTSAGSNPAIVVAGQLYKFTTAQMPNISTGRKHYPTAAFAGSHPLIDISGAALGNTIGTGSANAWQYCAVLIAGECRTGSAIGDVYVNAPGVQFPYCFQSAQNGNLTNETDICISGSIGVRDAITQVNIAQTDIVGAYQRVLTKFARPRVLSPFWTPTLLPNGKWMIFESQFSGDGTANKALMLAKVPPPPTADGINRTTFEPVTVSVPALAGSTAFLRFGYAENGNNLYCTSRQENCISVSPSSTFNAADPFRFETSESASYTPVTCGSGCSIVVPAIPNRVLYYQAVYNVSSAVSTGPVTAAVVP